MLMGLEAWMKKAIKDNSAFCLGNRKAGKAGGEQQGAGEGEQDFSVGCVLTQVFSNVSLEFMERGPDQRCHLGTHSATGDF